MLAIFIPSIVIIAKYPFYLTSFDPAETVNGRVFIHSSPIVLTNGDVNVTAYYRRVVYNNSNNNDNKLNLLCFYDYCYWFLSWYKNSFLALFVFLYKNNDKQKKTKTELRTM